MTLNGHFSLNFVLRRYLLSQWRNFKFRATPQKILLGPHPSSSALPKFLATPLAHPYPAEKHGRDLSPKCSKHIHFFSFPIVFTWPRKRRLFFWKNNAIISGPLSPRAPCIAGSAGPVVTPLFEVLKPGFRSLATLQLVLNVIGELLTEKNSCGIARFPCDSTAFLF